DEVLPRGARHAGLHVGARLAPRSGRRDEGRGPRAFRAEQGIQLRVLFADAHHDVRVREYDVFRVSISVEQFRAKGHGESYHGGRRETLDTRETTVLFASAIGGADLYAKAGDVAA